MSKMKLLALSILFAPLALLIMSWSADAQNALQGLGNSDSPVSISADNGIEWDQNAKTYIARGNAQASQDDFFVAADILTAFYDEVQNGNPDVHTLVAEGNVYASTATDELVGERLEYKVRQEYAVVTGRQILLHTAQGNLSASQKIIYDGLNLRAEAIGDPQISQGDNIVAARKLIAYFLPSDQTAGQRNSNRSNNLKKVEAFGKVFVTNGTAICRGEQGVYDVQSETAVLNGNVSCTQCGNQMVGDFATVNMLSGQAQVRSQNQEGSNGRTFLLLDPKSSQGQGC